jgi:hypothetical protein
MELFGNYGNDSLCHPATAMKSDQMKLTEILIPTTN